MAFRKNSANKAANLPAGIGLGILVSALITLICATGITMLVANEKITDNGLRYVIPGVLFLSSFVGAWAAATRIKRLRLQVCMLEGVGYLLALLATTALFFGGEYQGVWVSGLAILIGCLFVAFVPTFRSKKIKLKNRAYR